MNNETLETTLKDNNILETELSDSKVLETEITGIQKSMETDHSKLNNLDYEHSGHTGFQPAGNYIVDDEYTHTDNNYTDEEKTKLAGLYNYDDTEIKGDVSSLQSTKADKTELSSKQDTITSNNKLSSDLVDDTNKTNKFVTSQEKTTWNAKSDFSGSYNDLTDKPTIPVVPSNVSAFTNDSGYLTNTDFKTINNETIVGSGNIDISGGSSDYNDLSNIPIKSYKIDLQGVEYNSAEMKTLFTQILNDVNEDPNLIAVLVDYGNTYSDYQYEQIFILTDKRTTSNKYLATFKNITGKKYSSNSINKTDYFEIFVRSDTTKTDVETLILRTDTTRSFTHLDANSIKQYALIKTNTTSYTPTSDYHPATKKYVDDSITSAIGTALGGSY